MRLGELLFESREIGNGGFRGTLLFEEPGGLFEPGLFQSVDFEVQLPVAVPLSNAERRERENADEIEIMQLLHGVVIAAGGTGRISNATF